MRNTNAQCVPFAATLALAALPPANGTITWIGRAG